MVGKVEETNLKSDDDQIKYLQSRSLVMSLVISAVLLTFFSIFQLMNIRMNIEGFIEINSMGHLVDEKIWAFLTLLGDTGILWPMLLIFSITSMQTIYAVIAAVPLGGFLSVGLKRLFDSPRPSGMLDSIEFHVIGPVLKTHSFPSGHTITIFATAAAILLSCHIKSKTSNGIFKTSILVLAVLVGLSRIMVGAHWPLDCLAGACIGWLSGSTGVYVVNKISYKIANPKVDLILVALLWILSVGNLYRAFDYPASSLSVSMSFLISSAMFTIYIFKKGKSIASFFA